MITINNLTKQYNRDTRALQNLDLTIGAGMFGLVGPNGAGKTTLMRILAGLVKPSHGDVEIFGHNIRQYRGKQAAKSITGYLPQEPGFYPDLTATEFLDYMAILKGIRSRSIRHQQIESLLEEVHLTAVAHKKIKGYSGGMKRRVGVAQALLGDPKLVIVDEPTAGLDPEERVRLRNLLSATAKRCTVILSTHIVEDISQSCNDLAVLNHGQLLFRGTPRDLIQQAEGHVWTITTTGEQPTGAVSVVSTLQLQAGIQYRVLGQPAPHHHAQPAQPSLEDGYIWLMQQNAA
ncbi:MAG TPA: ABC transporter ATP-binding protein [Anaerolineae bacterium]|nr:ABC transporter ATP-binding protein [Anaerolineae bacterium]